MSSGRGMVVAGGSRGGECGAAVAGGPRSLLAREPAWAEVRESSLAVEVCGLTVRADGMALADGGASCGAAVLDGVDLQVARGGVCAVVGASGAGKSTLARALLGAVRPGLVWAEGSVAVDGRLVRELRGRELRRFRSERVAYLAQDPALSLTPWMRVGELLAEVGARGERAQELLAAVGLSGVSRVLRRRPGELSGGQRRRVALARAMAADPAVLVLDEPTSGLDSAAVEDVLAVVERLRAARGTAVLAVTHDLAAAERLGGELVVMARGRVVERGPVAAVVKNPASDYTRELLAAARLERMGEGVPAQIGTEPAAAGCAQGAGPGARSGDALAAHGVDAPRRCEGDALQAPVLRVRDLRVVAPDGKVAANGLSFDVRGGEGVALVGPSGAGKTTLVQVLLGLRAPDGGALELRSPSASGYGCGPADGASPNVDGGLAGADSPQHVSVACERALGGHTLAPRFADRPLEERLGVQLVPQDPATSLNPALLVGTQLMRACARRHPRWSRAQRSRRVQELLRMVGLDPSVLRRRPGRLSGGQAQRVAIARALAHEPQVLVLDESTSALDATTQRDVLAMLAQVRAQTGAAFVVVTHDPRVADYLCSQKVQVGE